MSAKALVTAISGPEGQIFLIAKGSMYFFGKLWISY